MTFPLTTAQALKSLAGVVLFGLGLDPARFVSCQLRQLLSFAIREGIGLLFCGVPVLAWLARTVARARFPGAFSGCGGLIAHPPCRFEAWSFVVAWKPAGETEMGGAMRSRSSASLVREGALPAES